MQTIHENKALMNAFIEPQPTLIEVLNNLENYVLSLQRYDAGHNDSIREDEEGEYILLKDVLALFSAKKE